MGDTGIGALLLRLRTERGWTQQRVADEYNALEGRAAKTGKEIGRYEREARVPVPYTRKYLAQVFGVDVVALDRAVAVSKSLRGEEDSSSGSSPEEPAWPAVPSRSGKGAISVDAVMSADFARFIAQRNADEFVVEQLEADVARLARAYVSHPLMELYVEIKRLRDGVFELLRGRQHPRQTADLYVAASRLCGLSAHVCLDLGDYDSAATHARTARACAEAAGHEGMLAWVRAVESLIAYWTGRYEQAARLAQAGRHHRAHGSIGARLASLEARALAIAGDQVGAVAALADAERSREATSGRDEVPGIFAFPAAKQFAYAGTSHLAVGGREHVRQAIASADTAVRLYRSAEDDDQSVGDLFAAHVDLARGHLLLGDLDGTEAMLGFVLESPPERMSASIVRRLTALGRELGEPQYGGAAQAAHLRERLQHTAVLAASPAAHPPELPT
ncbi:helix-turn-helix transcriptional regulator [Streptomyces viridochromogenes]|uniref:Putative transcriptional regulator n=1 Tax=Streptomyces viridochromogenes Tue57 TaxID=1160705 RepID=L8PIT7_STRVR|nr:helix-turn-helix transcriptional regulator [Streptomyces viridochromogenes]ELS56355.1 putative transcriptional regulator [Streptomyces viridochromogenes Tue57]